MSKPKKTPPKYQIGDKVQVLVDGISLKVGDAGFVTDINQSSQYGYLYFLDGIHRGGWTEEELEFFRDRCDCDHTRPFVPACLDCVLKRWP